MNANRSWKTLLTLALVVAAWAPRLSGQATDWKKIPIPPLHEFKPQQPKRIALPNGMVVFLQEDHELPLIGGTALIRGGSREELAEKTSLVSLYGQAWRTGGTKARTGDDLDDYLEARAAKVESGGGLDSTSLSWSCLKGDFDDVFKVFLEVLRAPEFRQDKIDLAKDQARTQISRRNDNPMQIASREATKLAYGANSPYARVPEYVTVAAVTRDDLLNWHKSTVHPNNIILSVAGDFDSAAMEAQLREAFASWPQGPVPKKADVTITDPKPGVYFVQKDDVNQSAIRMVHLGTTRDNPDYYALEVLNELFGGSFSSRLVSNIRTKKGLAYYVYGGVGTAFDHPGIFQMGMGTKSGSTATAIDALFEEVDGLDKNPPTVEELKKAKDAILNSFIFRFDSKQKVVRERMAYEFYGYPADFLERYRAGVEKVSQADVGRVARQYIHKDRLAVLVVGKAADFDRPLSSFGPISNIDISIPEMPGTKMAGPATSNAEGRALLAKVAEGMGGGEKVKSVKSLRQKVTILANTPQGEFTIGAEQVAVFPDRFWQKMKTPMGDMTMVVSPAAAFMSGAMGNRDLPASQKAEILEELKRDPLFVVQHGDDPKFTFAAGGAEKVGDVEAKILDVNADGAVVRWFVDPRSGNILRSSATATGPTGPAERVTNFADWKPVQGLSIPFKETRTRGGEKESSVEIHEIEINPAVDPKLFDRPEEKPAADTR
jgi:zinc protease